MSDPRPPTPAPVPASAAGAPPRLAGPSARSSCSGRSGVESASTTFQNQLVTGEVIAATAHPKADRRSSCSEKLAERTKQIVSGIRQFLTRPNRWSAKRSSWFDNLQPTKLRGEDSFGRLLAVRLPEGGLRLITTDGRPPSGLYVS